MSSSSSLPTPTPTPTPTTLSVPPSAPEQLCYVHCNLCDTILAVSAPCSSLFKTVTVRCGHCSNLLPVNLLLPSPPNYQFHTTHLSHSSAAAFLSPTPHNLMEEFSNPNPNNFLINQTTANDFTMPARVATEIPRPPPRINRPPEKRQRVPSAYNRFIKDEIQRIKSVNPDISHREAFSAAAKNWAHFPHIHFGHLPVPDHTPKNTMELHQEGDDVMVKDGRALFTFN